MSEEERYNAAAVQLQEQYISAINQAQSSSLERMQEAKAAMDSAMAREQQLLQQLALMQQQVQHLQLELQQQTNSQVDGQGLLATPPGTGSIAASGHLDVPPGDGFLQGLPARSDGGSNATEAGWKPSFDDLGGAGERPNCAPILEEINDLRTEGTAPLATRVEESAATAEEGDTASLPLPAMEKDTALPASFSDPADLKEASRVDSDVEAHKIAAISPERGSEEAQNPENLPEDARPHPHPPLDVGILSMNAAGGLSHGDDSDEGLGGQVPDNGMPAKQAEDGSVVFPALDSSVPAATALSSHPSSLDEVLSSGPSGVPGQQEQLAESKEQGYVHQPAADVSMIVQQDDLFGGLIQKDSTE